MSFAQASRATSKTELGQAAPAASLENHGSGRHGFLRRRAPFLLGMLAGVVLTPFVPAGENQLGTLELAGGLFALIVLAVALVPWARLPAWCEAIPPLLYLVVVALLHEDGSRAVSIYEALALLPAFWFLLHGTLRQLVTAVVGGILVFLIPAAIGENVADADLWRSAFAVAAGGLILLIIEVTRATDLRADSDSRLQTVVDTMPDGLVVVDERGQMVMSNRAADELLSAAAVRDALELPIGQVIQGEALDDQEIHVPTDSGDQGNWIGVAGAPLHGLDGETNGGVAIVWDISDRKRAEQHQAAQYHVSRALAQAGSLDEALYKLMEALGTSLGWKLGVFWRVEVKPVMSRSIGRPVRSLRYDSLWNAPGINAEKFEQLSSKLTYSSPIGLLGRVWESAAPAYEVKLDGGHSERINAAADLGMGSSICFPVIARDRVLGVVEFFTDEMDESQGNLLGVLASIGSQLGEFIERKRAEQEADRDKDAFFGLVSHELRTPLTSIIGYLDLFLQEQGDQLDEQSRHFVDIARRNSDRLLRLVGDLLLVAQVQTGRFSHESAPVDLDAIAAASVEAARPVAHKKGVAISYAGSPVPQLPADADRIGQLFDNLISNAIKFTPEGERIEVRVGHTHDRAICEVSNGGSYIPPEEGARLFERFYRGSNATDDVVQGVGLGLAIAKAIVQVHGGSIRYESHEGVGTTFRFWLPLSPGKDQG